MHNISGTVHEWLDEERRKQRLSPGRKFLIHDQNGVQIYISVTVQMTCNATKNLEKDGLPQATKDHILLKGKNDKTKEGRRQAVEKTTMLLFFRDSLTDFNDLKATGKDLRWRNAKC